MIRMDREEIKKKYGLRGNEPDGMFQMLFMMKLLNWEFPMFDQVDEFFKTQPQTAIEYLNKIWGTKDVHRILWCSESIKIKKHIFLIENCGSDEEKYAVKDSWNNIFKMELRPFPDYDELLNKYYEKLYRFEGTELEKCLEKPTIQYMHILTVTDEGRVLYDALRTMKKQM